jgi:hypothetical protein
VTQSFPALFRHPTRFYGAVGRDFVDAADLLLDDLLAADTLPEGYRFDIDRRGRVLTVRIGERDILAYRHGSDELTVLDRAVWVAGLLGAAAEANIPVPDALLPYAVVR